MKSSKLFYSIQLIAILAFIGFTQTSPIVCNASAEEIITVSTLEYHPWTGKELKNNGFVNHVITEAFKRKGYAVRYKYLPWKRAVLETKNGKYAALSYVYFSKDREKAFYLSDPISVEKIVFFHLKSTQIKDWKTLEDLNDYRFGATRGYTYTKEFWDLTKTRRLTVDVADSDIQNFKKLLAGRIDIFPSGLVNGNSILLKEFEAGKIHMISYHPKPLSQTTGHLAFARSTKSSENLLRVFNQGLTELKQAGLYKIYKDELLAGKYGQ